MIFVRWLTKDSGNVFHTLNVGFVSVVSMESKGIQKVVYYTTSKTVVKFEMQL